ncbi:SEC-C metal-binding domain-containing protein [Mucilaginibacter sp. SG564]
MCICQSNTEYEQCCY